MSTEAILALAFGVALGTFLTATTLWLHERQIRRALEDVGVRLRRSEARLQAMLRDSHDLIAVIDAEGRLTYASPAAERLFGRRIPPLLGSNPFAFLHPDDRDRALGIFFDSLQRPGETERVEVRAQHEDGSWRTLEVMGTNLLDDPAVEGFVVKCRDVSTRQRADAELREAQERFRTAFDHAPIGMALIAPDGRCFRANRALAQMLGRAEDELSGVSLLALTHPDDRAEVGDAMQRALSGAGAAYRIEQRYIHADGRPLWVAHSGSVARDLEARPLYFVCQIEDISERRASGELLAHQAIHDPLTGLPNRTLFVDYLQRALNESDHDAHLAVLFLDIDHFKVVNDTVARFGGDEFTVLCSAVPDETTAQELARRLSEAVAKPITLAEGEVFVTASVGIALSGTEHETAETLLRNADAAMYRAKDQGRARSELFRTDAHDQAVRHLRTGNELHRALERGELCMHYQPIVSLETGRISGFEALLRWEHPKRGLVGPDETALMRDAEAAVRALGALRSLGVHLAVDDFGTGYSSMTYLKRFPVEALKVDRTFVDGIGRDPEDSAICTAVVSLAHALGLRAVAEGVETPEQLAELRTLGCELAQGYLFGRPAAPETCGDRPDQRQWAAFSTS